MIKLIRLMVVHEHGTVDHLDFSVPSPARNSAIDLILNEKVDLGDGVQLKGFQISPIFENRISFHIAPVADLRDVLCDECQSAGAVTSLEPVVSDEERARGPRRDGVDVCRDCADKLLATGKWEEA